LRGARRRCSRADRLDEVHEEHPSLTLGDLVEGLRSRFVEYPEDAAIRVVILDIVRLPEVSLVVREYPERGVDITLGGRFEGDFQCVARGLEPTLLALLYVPLHTRLKPLRKRVEEVIE
jgi:hypothetical protein